MNKKLPILNHRYHDASCITPKLFLEYQKKTKKAPKKDGFPKYCIITSQNNIVEYLKKKLGAKKNKNWTSNRTNLYTFKIGRKNVGVINVGQGSPQAVIIAEVLISLGTKYFFIIGSIGGLQKKMKIGDLVLINKALRDEGTSFHYLPPSKYSFSSKKFSCLFKKFLIKQSVEFVEGAVWTTDAFFRETKKLVAQYQKESVLGIDMKTSALFALAKCREVDICAIFYVSDLLGNLKWEPHLYSPTAKDRQRVLTDTIILFIKNL